MTKVVTVIPTYNRLDLLKKSVQGVLNQTFPVSKLIVLNNGSTDGTTGWLRALVQNNATIQLEECHPNIGASGAIHRLLQLAIADQPDWIWIMDDDAEAAPQALERLLASNKASDTHTHILQCRVLAPDGSWPVENRPACFDPNRFTFEGITDQQLCDAGDSAGTAAIPVHTGGYFGMLLRPQALISHGYPRQDLYLWYDDVEFCLRVSRQNGVYLVPEAHIFHYSASIVPHRVAWPFRGPLPVISEGLVGRYYYLQRNWIWLAKQWLSPHRFLMFWIKQSLRNVFGPLVLWTHTNASKRGPLKPLLRSMAIGLKASIDGLLNRLGERVKTH